MVATPAHCPPQLHPCCFSTKDTPIFWDFAMTFTPMAYRNSPTQHHLIQTRRAFSVPNVQQMHSGGDALVLDTEHSDWIVKPSDHQSNQNTPTMPQQQQQQHFPPTVNFVPLSSMSFHTNILKSGNTAKLDVAKYFPHLLQARKLKHVNKSKNNSNLLDDPGTDDNTHFEQETIEDLDDVEWIVCIGPMSLKIV
ncbi:hypothetical protein HK100_005365 [Physocladia obscura]|uniref:Uncharacterized protein n=1 Tax=Physocladia obscura TaxID=109957 RepID=A0AAD5T6V7_9FUNG|nr:hypothetical protein HK100_005365 [Physocladia obscura]